VGPRRSGTTPPRPAARQPDAVEAPRLRPAEESPRRLLLFRPPAPHPLNGETRFPTGKRISENKKPDFHTEITFSETEKCNFRPENALLKTKSPISTRNRNQTISG